MIDIRTFYGFSEHPFDLAPDPKFFFASEGHREALAGLQYGIMNKKGFILLLADAGLGKTMLIRELISKMDPQVRIIYFPRVQMPFLQMLREMLIQLKLMPEYETKGSMVHCLYYHLIECLGRKENVALFLDGAEQIRMDVLEEVRLLSNLETGSSKLLLIVMAGRPDLGKKLQSDIVRQIEQRIVIHSRIPPLTTEESRQYIAHRLKVAGGSSAVFTEKALDLICKTARGVPLALNILCSNALLVGCCLSEKNISATTVKAIRREKRLLDEEKAETLASRIRKRLVRMLGVIFPIVVAIGLAWTFGKPHMQTFFNTPKAKQTDASSAVGRPATAPAVLPPVVTDQPPERLRPEIIISAEEARPPVPAPPAEDSADRQPRIKKTVEVKRGDNLSLLALRNYNLVNETLMDHILKLNPEITNPHLLLPNRKVRIPEITEALMIVPYKGTHYKIHLRTFGNLQNAEHYKRSAATWAKEIEIISWRISADESWYRVMAGSFTGRDKAMKALVEMQQKGFSLIPLPEEKVKTSR